jgi:hypothetical protein
LIVLSAACDGGLKNTLAVNASTPRRRHAIGICGKISSQSDCLLFAREAHSHMPTQPTRAANLIITLKCWFYKSFS